MLAVVRTGAPVSSSTRSSRHSESINGISFRASSGGGLSDTSSMYLSSPNSSRGIHIVNLFTRLLYSVTGRPDVTSADVLKVAERFEAWVTRDGVGAPVPA
jgi:hypothetical protein